MNTETGEIYHTPEEVKAAMERGEPLAEATKENIERMVRYEPVVPLTKGQLRRLMRQGRVRKVK